MRPTRYFFIIQLSNARPHTASAPDSSITEKNPGVKRELDGALARENQERTGWISDRRVQVPGKRM